MTDTAFSGEFNINRFSKGKRSRGQAIIGGQSPRKNKFLPLIGKVRLGFKQSKPHPIPLLVKEMESSSLKRTYRPNVLTSYRLKKCAFTLSEVLITLGIIGVVAAMTLPSVMQNYREKETVAKLKKVYSILSQALVSAINDTGMTVDQWDLKNGGSAEGSQELVEQYFKPHLKIADDCQNLNSCIGEKKYRYLNGQEHISYAGQGAYKHLVLADGQLVIFLVGGSFKNCSDGKSDCAYIYIDINGYYRGPNQFGKDAFMFGMKKDQIRPWGTQIENPKFSSVCNTKSSYGYSCTAWVIFNENMDYLHCDDLQWGTKTKCK